MTRLRRHRTLTAEQRSRELHPQELIRVGGWEKLFGKTGDLWLEVGTGKDTHIIERSLQNRDSFHVGIEVTRKKFEMMLRKAESLFSEDPAPPPTTCDFSMQMLSRQSKPALKMITFRALSSCSRILGRKNGTQPAGFFRKVFWN